MKLNTSSISRKKFLQTCGSVLAIGSIAGVSAVSFFRSAKPTKNSAPNDAPTAEKEIIASPYKLASSFVVDGEIQGFELWDDKFIIATQNYVQIHSSLGNLLKSFAIGSDLRDIAVYDGRIYLLFPAGIEVCNMDGGLVYKWDAYSDRSDYCSFAVASGSVYVTDAANKNICKYGIGGNCDLIKNF